VTLLLTAVSASTVIQVSDTRLTRLDGSLFDDQRCKTILYCDRVSVSFTGIAIIDGVAVHDWVANAIAPVTTVAGLRQRLKSELNALDPGKLHGLPLILVLAGWWRLAAGDPLTAFVAEVSNVDSTGRVKRNFQDRSLPISTSAGVFVHGCWAPTGTERRRLERSASAFLARKHRPDRLIESLMREQRTQANRDARIGHTSIVATLAKPHNAATDGDVKLTFGPSAQQEARFASYDETGNRKRMSPVFVCRGSILSDFDSSDGSEGTAGLHFGGSTPFDE
jgi:hypothetical protein